MEWKWVIEKKMNRNMMRDIWIHKIPNENSHPDTDPDPHDIENSDPKTYPDPQDIDTSVPVSDADKNQDEN